MAKAELVLEVPARRSVQIARAFAYRSGPYNGNAHQAQFWILRHQLPRRGLQRRVALVIRMLGIDRHHDYGHAIDRPLSCLRRRRAASCAPPPRDLYHETYPPSITGAFAESDLLGMSQVESDVRS